MGWRRAPALRDDHPGARYRRRRPLHRGAVLRAARAGELPATHRARGTPRRQRAHRHGGHRTAPRPLLLHGPLRRAAARCRRGRRSRRNGRDHAPSRRRGEPRESGLPARLERGVTAVQPPAIPARRVVDDPPRREKRPLPGVRPRGGRPGRSRPRSRIRVRPAARRRLGGSHRAGGSRDARPAGEAVRARSAPCRRQDSNSPETGARCLPRPSLPGRRTGSRSFSRTRKRAPSHSRQRGGKCSRRMR